MSISVKNPVGRPREFDEALVLEAAMDVFWRHGYEKSSLSELLDATGLHKGSLYQAFGDKHSLFIQALRRYTEKMMQTYEASVRGAPSGLEGLRRCLYSGIEMADDNDTPCGCMAINTLIGQGREDPDAIAVLESAYRRRLELVGDWVRQAQAEGSIRKDLSPERVATLATMTVIGTVAGMKGPIEASQAKALVDDLLLALGHEDSGSRKRRKAN